MYPAKTVAGDYFGFIELPAGEIAVVIADVSGKGVAPSLLRPSIEVAAHRRGTISEHQRSLANVQ
jgi:serine phosphatase RsbU (regulator of sigma subunit)